MVRAQATASAAPPTGTRPGGSKARAGPAGRHMEDLPRWDDTSGGSAHSGAYGQAVTTKPRRRAVLTRRSRALHDSLTIAPDHQGVNSTDTPRPTRPARTGRLVLATVAAGSAAALLLAGCGSGAPARPAPAAAAPGPRPRRHRHRPVRRPGRLGRRPPDGPPGGPGRHRVGRRHRPGPRRRRPGPGRPRHTAHRRRPRRRHSRRRPAMNPLRTRLAAAALGAGLVIAVPAAAWAGPLRSTTSTSSTATAAPSGSTRLTIDDLRTKCLAAIDVRLPALASARSDVAANPFLTDADRSALTTDIDATTTRLQSLQGEIRADTDLASLRDHCRSIFADNRVFALVLPRTRLVVGADTATAAGAKLTGIAQKLAAAV